ncbi:MAG: cytochrome c [Phycisphaerales bacterium]
MVTKTTTRLVLTSAIVALAAIAGCRGDRSASRPRQFLPDMDDSPKFKPQTQTPFFADGRAMRKPVEHTVPFGASTVAVASAEEKQLKDVVKERGEYLKEDVGFYFGTSADGKYLENMPGSVIVDRKLLERGQERFNIYCSVCHGYTGDGKGTVGKEWQGAVANFHDAKFQRLDTTVSPGHEGHNHPSGDQYKDGYIFHIIRNGLPADDPKQPMRMPSYGYSVTEADAWAIVAYVRALQTQQSGTTADLSPEQRTALEATRNAEIEKIKKQRADEAAKAAAAAKPADSAPAGQKPAPKGPEVKP